MFKFISVQFFFNLLNFNKKLERIFNVKPVKIENFTQYLNAYGYKSYEHYNEDDKIIQYDDEYEIGYPEYTHFLKKNEYIPYLHEAHYHLFEEPDTKPYRHKTILWTLFLR